MWADVLNTLGMTKTSKNHVRKKVSKVVVVVERALNNTTHTKAFVFCGLKP